MFHLLDTINQIFDPHKLDCSRTKGSRKIAYERRLLLIYLFKFFSCRPLHSVLLCDNLISVIASYATTSDPARGICWRKVSRNSRRNSAQKGFLGIRFFRKKKWRKALMEFTRGSVGWASLIILKL